MGLTNLFDGLSEIAKLTIIAYSDENFQNKTGETFEVMYNPNTFSENFGTVYSPQRSIGGTADTQSFMGQPSNSVSFDFLFDGTGVSGVGSSAIDLNPDVGKVGYVQEQIDAFMNIAQLYVGEEHRTNHLELSWGTFHFYGVMERATVTYKLFHSSGAPLRANVNATFTQTVSREEQAALARRRSPDLTHFRIVKAGETLPLIAKKVYGDSKYYLEIARVNNINNFRKLKAGQQLVLPPVDKKENG
jgi:LysM repeat protein